MKKVIHKVIHNRKFSTESVDATDADATIWETDREWSRSELECVMTDLKCESVRSRLVSSGMSHERAMEMLATTHRHPTIKRFEGIDPDAKWRPEVDSALSDLVGVILSEEYRIESVDETYREFVYDDQEPFSILNLEPKSDRVIVIDSLSKRFSLCGARIGCMISPTEQVMESALKIAQARLAAPTLSQFASAHLLENIRDDFLEGVIKEFRVRRDALYTGLKEIPGVIAHKPQGAFYSVVQLPVDNADDFAAYMLDEFSYNGTTTFIAPAAGFYMLESQGLQQARVAYVLNKDDIQAALAAIAAGLQSYSRR